MSEVLIVGSMALDSVKTPFGQVDRVVGGAAVYAATAASLMAPPRVVGIVGGDFPQGALDFLAARGADLAGVERVPEGKSFYWSGVYDYDLSDRETLDTQLNVFADFDPTLPANFRQSRYCFLANIQPQLQLSVLEQIEGPCFVMCDSMNLWIETERDALLEVLSRVDLALLNDAEIRQLTGTSNLARAAACTLELGPDHVVIKQGEYGAALVSADDHFSIPSYPLPDVVDPTGAGDSFAGGMLGFLAREDSCGSSDLRRAVVLGSAAASACVEGFSLEGLKRLDVGGLYERYETIRQMVQFDTVDLANGDSHLFP